MHPEGFFHTSGCFFLFFLFFQFDIQANSFYIKLEVGELHPLFPGFKKISGSFLQNSPKKSLAYCIKRFWSRHNGLVLLFIITPLTNQPVGRLPFFVFETTTILNQFQQQKRLLLTFSAVLKCTPKVGHNF